MWYIISYIFVRRIYHHIWFIKYSTDSINHIWLILWRGACGALGILFLVAACVSCNLYSLHDGFRHNDIWPFLPCFPKTVFGCVLAFDATGVLLHRERLYPLYLGAGDEKFPCTAFRIYVLLITFWYIFFVVDDTQKTQHVRQKAQQKF